MDDISKRTKLIEFGSKILHQKSLPDGLPLISEYAKDIIGAERCSMFIYKPRTSELWTTLADGVEKIVVPADKGIVGQTLQTKKAIIENDVHSNPAFLVKVDEKTGYTTKNLITTPIFNYEQEIVGVLQLLNKEGGFSDEDVKYMKFFSRSLGDFIELANLYER